MTRALDRIERKAAAEALQQILRGAQLDSFHVRSVDLTLCFFNGDADDKPVYVWLQTGAMALVCGADLTEWPAAPADSAAFHARRAELLPMLYGLIGDSVAAVAIAPDGALSVSFTERSLILAPGAEELDEIWSVTDRTPDTFDPEGWRIVLANSGKLTIKQPE
jgi:hypothetical protein